VLAGAQKLSVFSPVEAIARQPIIRNGANTMAAHPNDRNGG
jgi:hypothetical protein